MPTTVAAASDRPHSISHIPITMDFEYRQRQSQILIDHLNNHFWNDDLIAPMLTLTANGVEHQYTKSERQRLYHRFSLEDRRAIYAPDFQVVAPQTTWRGALLDCKVTRTPLYHEPRIRFIRRVAHLPNLHYLHIGQWEVQAYHTYKELSTPKRPVIILNYCAYLQYGTILCDYIERVHILHQDRVRHHTYHGSARSFVNVHLGTMRTLERFLADEFHLSCGDIASRLLRAKTAIRRDLPVIHHKNSPFAYRNASQA